jgi:hypothetical protein
MYFSKKFYAVFLLPFLRNALKTNVQNNNLKKNNTEDRELAGCPGLRGTPNTTRWLAIIRWDSDGVPSSR